ncbi:MAG TPA: class I SAM-dependent methyltransferase [Bryobacteraceae bacterium]|jgi:ubiquinone/menaquinone biosynthesis C-methylase UbiE
MNLIHQWLCRSDGWRQRVESEIMPWVLKDVDLGRDVLEVGPGPGVTTDWLQPRVPHLTCVEVDGKYADALARRMAGRNVKVLHQDASAMSLPPASFDAAVCCTMLHHVPSAELQDRLLASVARVLRPGGVFAGIDSRYSARFRMLHLFDTMVVVDPETFPARLKAAGFTDIRIDANDRAFRFRARTA